MRSRLLLRAVACLIGFVWATWAAPPVGAIDVFTFREADLDRHTRAVSDGGVVDINSTLDIRVSIEEIYRQAGGAADSLAVLTQVLEPLVKLQAGIGAGADNLEPLREVLSRWTARGADSLQWVQVREALRRVANPAAKILEATEGTPLAARMDQALDQAGRVSIAQQYALVFSSLDAEIEALRSRREQLATGNGISVRAGAWLRGESSDVPVHLEGFDRYPEQDEVVVPRWRIALSDEERVQLRASVQLSQALNDGELGRLMGNGFASAVRQLASLAEPCAASLKAVLVEFRDQLGQSAEPVKSAAMDALDRAGRLQASALDLRAKYGGGGPAPSSSPEALLLGTNDDLVALTSEAQELATAIREMRRIAEQTATSATLRAVLRPILDWKPDSCETSLARIRDIGRDIAGQCLGALGLRRRNTALLAFGQEVLTLDLANVPKESVLRIPRMGPRKPGDVVEIRVSVVRASTGPRDLQRTRITLRRVLPHIEIAVGLVFARADTSGRPRSVFQTAPAYAVLIKGWPIRSYRHSDLLNFGYGLSLAALDFNHDDSQELGVGFVLSGFLENLLQVGYGYNVKAGVPYTFFGLRLPLPDLGLGRTKVDAGSSQ